MTKPQTVEELIERYDTDPLFHSIVDQVNSGWTDDDGVAHEGPSVFSARKASEIMSAVQPVIDALTAERDGYKRWAGEFDRFDVVGECKHCHRFDTKPTTAATWQEAIDRGLLVRAPEES